MGAFIIDPGQEGNGGKTLFFGVKDPNYRGSMMDRGIILLVRQGETYETVSHNPNVLQRAGCNP